MRAETQRADRGAVLILVLGIVALLAFLAAGFALLTSVEAKAAANSRDSERARFAAWSGIERAKFELRRASFTPGYPIPWAMPDQFNYTTSSWNENNFFTSTYPSSYAPPTQISPTAIDTQTRPSFGIALSPLPTPWTATATVTNPAPGIPWPSGFMGATYYVDAANANFLGDYYSLRVTPATAQLYLNDSNPGLSAMLDTLTNVVIAPATAVSGVGAAIISGRPSAGYIRVTDIENNATLTTLGLSTSQIQSLEPYLTCEASVDRKVISRAGNLTLLPRAPVDVNWASYPVLVAVLNRISATDPSFSGTGTVDFSTAESVATAIMQYRANPTFKRDASDTSALLTGTPASRRYGFSRWYEFVQFLNSLVSAATVTQDQAMAILANCNPNTDLNKFYPDFSNLRKFDKSDLTASTTEFCFSPGAVFTIESEGIVLGPYGTWTSSTSPTVVATAKVRSVVRVFETYIETNQADFEADRIDASSTIPGMRDICTLPECRNTLDFDLAAAGVTRTGNADYDLASLGLSDATYDGQLTFNVITQAAMADTGDATYAGFIDRTVWARRTGQSISGTPVVPPSVPSGDSMALVAPLAAGSSGVPAGYKPVRTNQVSVASSIATEVGPGPILGPNASVNPLTSPDFVNGTDLHPLASIVGRSGRAFAFYQDQVDQPATGVIAATAYTVPQQTISATLNGTIQQVPYTVTNVAPVYSTTDPTLVVTPGYSFYTVTGSSAVLATISATLNATIAAISYDSCDTTGFELWFKPGKLASTQMLLDWRGGGVISITDNDSNPGDDYVGPTGILITPTAIPAFTVGFTPQSRSDTASVGAKGAVQIWLDPGSYGTDDPSFSYDLKCSFQITKPSDLAGSDFNVKYVGGTTSTTYTQTWDYEATSGNKIFPGTWHHVAFTFAKPPDPSEGSDVVDPVSSGGHNAFLYVDGNSITCTSPEPYWPTEIEPSARLVSQSITRMQNEFSTINANLLSACVVVAVDEGGSNCVAGTETNIAGFDDTPYRVPSVLLVGGTPSGDPDLNVFVGTSHDGMIDSTSTSVATFAGLIDNVIFDSHYLIGQRSPQLQTLPAGEAFLPRYDCFRPSTDPLSGADTRSDGTTVGYMPPDSPLVFKKETKALEWDQPVRICSYDATAWKSVPSTGGSTEGELGLGQVFVRFGWCPSGGAVPALPTANSDGSGPGTGNGTSGWTASLDEAPYNPFTNGYVVPARSSTATTPVYVGFQTLPGEQENYAIAITPTTDSSASQMGPRMAPVVDDVTVNYVPMRNVIVLEEEEEIDH
jgi:hypothetical protein